MEISLFGAAVAGLFAGLAVAVPLGPIGVMLVDLGARRGFRLAAAGAVGVALVDLTYAALAVTVGATAQPAVASIRAPLAIVGAAVLAGIGAAGVWRSFRPVETAPAAIPTRPAQPLRTFGAFVALTGLNPATLLTFSAITVGLGSRLEGPDDAAAFVAGVALASAAWQLALVAVGAWVGRSRPSGVQRWSRRVGGALLLAFAIGIAVGAV